MKPHRAPEALLGKQLAAVRRLFSAALKGDREAVHDLRVATRRLREALPVVGVADADAPARKARRTARRMTRTLRDVRELDVCFQLLDELARTKTAPLLALGRVRTRLSAERAREWRRVLDHSGRLDPERLGRRVDRTTAALSSVPRDGWRANLSKRLALRANLVRRALDDAGNVYSRSQLHRVRLSAKKLRYALEVASGLGAGRNLVPLQRQLKRVQQTLGDLHDRAVLADHVREVASFLRTTEPATADALDTLAVTLDDQCRRLHAKFVTAQPTVRDVADRATLLASRLRRPRRRVRMLKIPLAAVTRRQKVG
jgi:CHAD domain-containing protein